MGDAHFGACLEAIHSSTLATVEVRTPDLRDEKAARQTVLSAQPEVLGHNVEVVPLLYPRIRAQAGGRRLLQLLDRSQELCSSAHTKSGLMVALGEQEQEVVDVIRDLRAVGFDVLTIGQYLRPSARHQPGVEYVPPALLRCYAQIAKDLGFRGVMCGPFVRSSYRAGELLQNARRVLWSPDSRVATHHRVVPNAPVRAYPCR